MSFENFKTKESVVIVYTGEGKGKTSASLGLMIRALGAGLRVAYIQFIKNWQVSEHDFIDNISKLYEGKLLFYKGGQGFYNAGDISEANISEEQHRKSANQTYDLALESVSNSKYDLVICDEINNAVHDGLITVKQLEKLFASRSDNTSLCLTGRNFPEELLDQVDIATHMTKIKHHYDNNYIANKGIDY